MEADPVVLTIDHIDNNGEVHRREIGRSGGIGFWEWLCLNNFPKNFQILCRNCNWRKYVQQKKKTKCG